MGCTKYPILDDDFPVKMLGACYNDEERGLVTVLDLTGMPISSLCRLTPSCLVVQGSSAYLRWTRPRTGEAVQTRVPPDSYRPIKAFLSVRRKSRQHYHAVLKAVGTRAGYPDVSPMTFRHNRCVRGLTTEGYSLSEITGVMGCTLQVAARNYSLLREGRMPRGVTDGRKNRASPPRGLRGFLKKFHS